MSEPKSIPRVPRLPTPPPIPPTAPDPLCEAMDLLRGIYESQQQTNAHLERIAYRLEATLDVHVCNQPL